MKRFILFIVLLAVAILPLSACTTQETPPADTPGTADTPPSTADTPGTDDPAATMSIGVTCADLTIPAYTSITNILSRLCGEADVEITLLSANRDPAQQVTQMENFIQDDVDVIIVVEPTEASALVDVTQRAMDDGVCVIGYGLAIEGNTMDLVCPNEEIGYELGLQVVEWCQANYPGEEVEVGFIHGRLNTQGGKDRYDGVNRAFEENPGVCTVVSDQVTATTEEGMTMTESMLQANPDIKVVVATTGGGGIGANEAFMSNGLTDQSQYAVFGVDTTQDILTMLVDGTQPFQGTMCVGSDKFMAETLFEMSNIFVSGESFETNWLSKSQRVTIDNVRDYITNEEIDFPLS